MSETLKLLLSLSLSGSILALLIFAVKPFIKSRLSKSVQYYIWIVVLLRLVMPFSFEDSIMNNVFYRNNISEDTKSQISVQPLNNAEEIVVNSLMLKNVEENTANGIYSADTDHNMYLSDLIKQYIFYLWLLGVIITLAVNIIGYLRFTKYLKQANRPTANEASSMLIELLNGRCNVRLVRNRFLTTPMLIGIIRPYIIIPDISFSEKQLKNILLHEIVHYKRFDIGVKWLTMIAASIHWFNPFMYFIKKEINCACELACDEAVIKNLSAAEKQAYGDTLISVVAQQKYPVGVLQATMCEEKKSLRERLVAIMNHNKKSKAIIILSGILLLTIIFGSLYLGAGVGFGKSAPPNIYISTEDSEAKEALLGTYSWSYNGKHIESDSDHPANFKYKSENIVSITGKQQIILGTQKLKSDKKYDFTIGGIDVYKDGQLVEFESPGPSFMNGYLYLQAPTDAGEYIYHLVLNFKDRGTVNYGFMARVDMMTYDLNEISKHRTPYVGDHVKVSAIAGLLPVPHNSFRQQYISMKTAKKPYSLAIYYEAKPDREYPGDWPIVTTDSSIETNSRRNALVVFCMIDNVDEVTFAFRNSQSDGKLDESKYDTTYTFSRASIEERYGNLSDMSENLGLLRDKLEDKITAFKGLELYVWRKPELTGNDDIYYTLLPGTNRNKTKSEVYDQNTAITDINLIKRELSKYSSGTHLFIIHNMDIDKETMSEIGDELSGMIKNGVISIGGSEFDEYLRDDEAANEFTDAEVAAARAVVEEYFRAVAAKDGEAILKTLTAVHNHPNVVLYGEETRTLLGVYYDPNDPMRDSYISHGRGRVNNTKKENVIVFKVKFNVKYPKGVSGSFNEGDYDKWNMILIRSDKDSPWLIDDQGV